MPRHYAAEILSLRTRQERRKALEQVPQEWRGLVRKHVEIVYDRKNKSAKQGN